MHAPAINPFVSYGLQVLCYGTFIGVVGFFSSAPPYVHLQPNQALVKLSLQHAGQRLQPCHERTPEELARLAPNMRAASVCPRERAPITVAVTLDDVPLFAATAPPSGLARDGATTLYRRAVVTAGLHRIRASLRDSVSGNEAYAFERTIDLAPGRVLVLDFDAKSGGWLVHS